MPAAVTTMRVLFTVLLLMGLMTIPGLVSDEVDLAPAAEAKPDCPYGGEWPLCMPNIPNCYFDGDLTVYCHF